MTLNWQMKSLLASIFFGLALSGGGCAVSDTSVKAQADQTNLALAPAELDQRIPDVNAYFQQIGDRIVASARQLDQSKVGPTDHFKADTSWMFTDHIQFHLVNSKTLNALTTGGDHVYVYNALFQMCKNEDELAAVMSHEFAHIYCRHVQAGTKRQEELQGAATGVGLLAGAVSSTSGDTSSNQTVSQATLSVGQFIGNGFTRGDESQADEFGFKIYCQAGWDPQQFANFFKTMIAAGYDTTPTLLSDHPKLADRVNAVNQWNQAYQAGNPTSNNRKPELVSTDQFNQFKQEAQTAAANSPDDQSLAKAQQLLNAFPSCVAHTESPEQVEAKKQVLHEIGADPAKVHPAQGAH